MIHKKLFLTCLFLCLTYLSFSQSVSWGKLIDLKKTEKVDYIIGQDESGYYVSGHNLLKVRFGEVNPFANQNIFTYQIFRFDKNLNLKKKAELDLGTGDDKKKLEKVLLLDNKLYGFYSWVKLKEQTNTLYVREIDKNNLTFIGEEKAVAKLRFPDIKPNAVTLYWKKAVNNISLGEYVIETLENTSVIKVSISPPHDLRKKDSELPRSFNMLLDASFQVLAEQSVIEDIEENILAETDLKLDEASYYFTRKDIREEKAKDPVYTYSIFERKSIDADPEKLEIDIQTEGRTLTDIEFHKNADGHLVCLGFFTRDSWWYKTIGGTFFMKIDPSTGKVLHENFQDIPIDFILRAYSEKQREKLKGKKDKGKITELPNIEEGIQHLFPKENGGYVVVTEHVSKNFAPIKAGYSSQFYDETTGTVWGTNTSQYSVRSSDIIVFHLDKDGKMENAFFIPKRQFLAGPNARYSSYAIWPKGDDIHAVFIDSDKNTDMDSNESEHLKRMDKGIVTFVEMDESGNKKRKTVTSFQKSSVNIRAKTVLKVSENERVFLGVSFKEQMRLGKMVID